LHHLAADQGVKKMNGKPSRVVDVEMQPTGLCLPESGPYDRQRHEQAQELQGDPKLASMPPSQGSAKVAALRWPPDHTASAVPHTVEVDMSDPQLKKEPAGQRFSSFAGEASSFNRDDSKIYPSNPPRSPHLAWLNLFGPGLAQVVYGKTSLGVAGIVLTHVISFFSYFPIPLLTTVCGIAYLVLLITSIVDAYKTAAALRNGLSVGKWQLFPRTS
jgi:hypothetical protein